MLNVYAFVANTKGTQNFNYNLAGVINVGPVCYAVHFLHVRRN